MARPGSSGGEMSTERGRRWDEVDAGVAGLEAARAAEDRAAAWIEWQRWSVMGLASWAVIVIFLDLQVVAVMS